MGWTVRVEPSGIEFEVEAGESVAEAAWRQDLVWPTKCWGQAKCMGCYASVIDGELAALPAEDLELDAMRLFMSEKVRGPMVRLGCQIRVKRDGLVLEKEGVRTAEPADSNHVDGAAG